MTYAAGTSGQCTELTLRISDASDVEQLYARFTQRFPELMKIAGRVARRQAGPEDVAGFIGQTYRIADPSLRSIPPGTDTGYDSWCPRGGGEMKYFDRVPLNAMIHTGYFNCLYGAALLGRALSDTGCAFSVLTCPDLPAHPYVAVPGRPESLFSFHHDGLRRHRGHVEIRDRRYTTGSLTPVSDYGASDHIYGLSVLEHFLIPTRLVPVPDNVERATEAFEDLAAGLDRYPRLTAITAVIRLSIIPRLRSGPVPFPRTIQAPATTAP